MSVETQNLQFSFLHDFVHIDQTFDILRIFQELLIVLKGMWDLIQVKVGFYSTDSGILVSGMKKLLSSHWDLIQDFEGSYSPESGIVLKGIIHTFSGFYSVNMGFYSGVLWDLIQWKIKIYGLRSRFLFSRIDKKWELINLFWYIIHTIFL